MRVRSFWPLGIVLLGLLSGPSCEDDPDDLLVKAGSGGAPAAGTSAKAGSSAAGNSSAAGRAGTGDSNDAGPR